MPASSSLFPAFITDEYRPGNGFAQFDRERVAAETRLRQGFEGAFSDIQQIASRALSMPRNAFGSLDLGVDNYRQAAAAANTHALALREVATAAERAAIANGDTSEQTRVYVQAARAAATEAELQAHASNQQATAMERLQAELNQTRSGTTAVIAGNRMLIGSQEAAAVSSRGQRFAMVQVGQQVQDMAIQLQMGVPAQQIFVQQVSQMGFALSQLQGKLGRIGTFLTGGWGTALFLGIAAIGYLTSALRGNREAADAVAEGSTGLAEAQSALGEMFDLTTGKIENQTEALRLQARQMAINLRAQAMVDEQTSRETLGDTGERSWMSLIPRVMNRYADDISRAQASQAERLLEGVRSGRMSREQATRQSEGMDWSLLTVSPEQFREALELELLSRERRRHADAIDRSLDTGVLDPSLRREGRDRRPREDQRPQQAEQALERIQRINEAYDEQPRIVDRAAQALRELDQVLADAQRRRLPRFDEMVRGANEARDAIRDGIVRQITEGFEEQPKLIDRATEALDALNAAARELGGDRSFLAQLERARTLVIDALNRPYREFLEDQVRAYDIGQLIVQGREEEAEAVSIIHRLEQQLGPLSEERRQTILESVVALREQARELEIIRERQGAYLRAAGEVRSAIEDVLANPQRGLRGIGDLASSLSQAFNRLNAEVIVDRLFGGVFRQIDDFVTGRDRVRQANEEMAASIGSARAAVLDLSSVQQDQVQSVEDVIAATDRLVGAFDGATARLTQIQAGSLSEAAQRTVLPGLPVSGRITDSFAEHRARGSAGLDIAAPAGTSISARAAGRVVTVGYDSRSGNFVIVDHGGGIVSSYSHLLQRSSLRPNQQIGAGDTIGQVGSTGHSTGNHLHYRIKVNGRDVDPETFRFPQEAVEHVAAAATAVEGLGAAAAAAAGAIREANDNLPAAAVGFRDAGEAAAEAADDAGATVTAKRYQDPTAHLSPRAFMQQLLGNLVAEVFGKRVGEIVGRTIVDAMEGAAYGQFAATTIFGRSGGGLASQIGGALGNVAGNALSHTLTSVFGKTIGGFAGPIGSIVGGLAGSLLSGAFRSTPRASTTIVGADGRLQVAGSTGTRRLQGQTVTAADSVIATVERIAELFGGTLSGAGAVSIGIRNGAYRVDPSGQGRTKLSKGAIDFGEDAEAATRAAVLNLIQDGMIAGLRAGTQRLLQNAKDIDSGIEKALKFEGVFTDLKRHLDPVGASLDELDKKFGGLRRVLDEAGASAEEYAQLEQLYGIERTEAIKQAAETMTSALKALMDDLTVNNDARSLRERLTMAQAKYDPLAARVAAGDRTAFDEYSDAARSVLDIQRQISGSTSPYFQLLDQVTALTSKALADQENLISIATGRPSPLAGGAADTTTPVVGAIDRLGDYLVNEIGGRLDGHLAAVNDNLGTIIRQGIGGGGANKPFDPFVIGGKNNF